MTDVIIWAIVCLVVLAIVIVFVARFYERSTKKTSLVKTGVGGRKVVMDGGTIAIPYFHEISRINMQTLRLEVTRAGNASLITNDRLRVDVSVNFYMVVIDTEEGVAYAAQTLGDRTFDADKVRELLEGKLIDALRSVAARMSMDDLHENRGVFVADVRESLKEPLAKNGLELESVSLTALDQTPFSALDEDNAFNAVGMRKLAEVIAKSKKERAEIDADADVSVRRAAMQAAKQKLEIDLEEQEAQISQVQQIESLRAAQLAEVAKRKADGERESALARIQMEQNIRAADIDRERAVREAEISNEKHVQETEIARERDIELANQQRQITLAKQSEEVSKAKASADTASAQAVRDAEAIATAKQVAEADRRKQISLIAAMQDAENAAVKTRIAAEAEKDAEVDRSKARIEVAKAEANATELRSAARKKELLAQAEGQRALIDAENKIGETIAAMKIDLAKIEAMPKLVAEMVKPAEKIESIKVHQISGLGGSSGTGQSNSGNKSAVNQLIESIMEMAVQLPALKKIGEDIGLSIDSGLDQTQTKTPSKEDDSN